MSLEARNDEFSSKIVYAAVVTRGEHVACARLRPRGALKLRRCLIRYPERPLEPSDHKRPCLPIAPILLQHSASFAQHLCSARTCPRLQASCWIVSRGLRCLILLPRDGLQAIGTRRRAPPSNPYCYSTVHSSLANCLVIFLQMPPKGKPRFSSVKRKTGENPHSVPHGKQTGAGRWRKPTRQRPEPAPHVSTLSDWVVHVLPGASASLLPRSSSSLPASASSPQPPGRRRSRSAAPAASQDASPPHASPPRKVQATTTVRASGSAASAAAPRPSSYAAAVVRSVTQSP